VIEGAARRTGETLGGVVTWIAAAALLLAASGCAAHRAPSAGDEVKVTGEQAQPAAEQPAIPPPDARPPTATVETTDQRLAAALADLTAAPSAAAHRRLGDEYVRVGIRDAAQDQFTAAVQLDPLDAASYDARARLWRDWGAPQIGLGDAYRAVSYAPESPVAANTLGTLLQALRDRAAARQWYVRALTLDPGAWYALNNLCYVEILMRRPTAIALCEQAVAAAGATAALPQNNLALAYAAAGDLDRASGWFRRASPPAVASYNYGILMMSLGAYAQATASFQAALLQDPAFTLAASRVRQARQAAQEQQRARN